MKGDYICTPRKPKAIKRAPRKLRASKPKPMASPLSLFGEKGPAAPIAAVATSFATFKDLVGYIKCLLAGGSQNFCYSKGDNGIGAWGDVTAQLHTPMCAVPPSEMVKRWGTSRAARGKRILVTLTRLGKTVACECRDKAPERPIIDLNPAALLALGLPADTELKEPAFWHWA